MILSVITQSNCVQYYFFIIQSFSIGLTDVSFHLTDVSIYLTEVPLQLTHFSLQLTETLYLKFGAIFYPNTQLYSGRFVFEVLKL